jgi:predicted lysophospholipase L1 biosynthesis ABC-type transport system permease subunit
VVGVAPLQARSLDDPLAAGTREVLGVAAWLAVLLGVASLVIATRSVLSSERALLAEYEALGVPPRTLARSTQLSLVLLAALGVAAGCVGALLAVRLVGAFVAVTATATQPLLPIQTVVAWAAGSTALGAIATGSLVAVTVLARRTMREPPTRRLRA